MHDAFISLGGSVTLTNVGSSYDAIQASRGLGSVVVDFTGYKSLDFRVGVNKIGSGTQSWQLWNMTDGAELGVIDDAGATGDKVLTATINSLPSGIKLLRVRTKSTVAADDPVYNGATLRLVRPTITFERLGLAEQIIRNAYQLTSNMRDNANGYKAALVAGQTVQAVATIMTADAGLYLTRLGWFTSLATENLALLTQVLGDYALVPSNLATFRDNLIAVAEHTQAATLDTSAAINAEADYILANVPDFKRLW